MHLYPLCKTARTPRSCCARALPRTPRSAGGRCDHLRDPRARLPLYGVRSNAVTLPILIRAQVHDIAYPNFKDNIPDPGYRWAATNVWQEMLRLQED